MVRIARMIGFFFSAVGVESASGVGLVALLVAALIGWKRAGAHWLLASAVAGAIAAQTVFVGDTVADAKVKSIDQRSVVLDLGTQTQVLTLR